MPPLRRAMTWWNRLQICNNNVDSIQYKTVLSQRITEAAVWVENRTPTHSRQAVLFWPRNCKDM